MTPTNGDSPLCTKLERPKPEPKLDNVPKLVDMVQQRKNSIKTSPTENKLVLIEVDGTKPLKSHSYDEKDTINTFFEQMFFSRASLGTGSFGEVYSAVSREDKLEYAVKVALEKTSKLSLTKYSEVRNHMILTHPNIVRFVRAWEDREILHIQTELCVRSLDKYLEKKHKLPETTVWNISVDVLQGLNYMHSKGMLHNDIKPENILMTEHLVCKLGDFGLAVRLDGVEEVEPATEGDKRYLASEVLLERKLTKASDVFSFGVTLLEAATDLYLPGRGSGWRKIRNGQIPELLFKDVSEALKALIAKMMSINASERPTTKELLEHPEIKKRLEDRTNFIKRCSEVTPKPIQSPMPIRRVKSAVMVTPNSSQRTNFQSPVRTTFGPSAMITPNSSQRSTQTRYLVTSRSEEKTPSQPSSSQNQQQPMASVSTPTSSRPKGTRQPMRRSALDFSTNSDEPESSTGCPKIKRAKSFSHKETD